MIFAKAPRLGTVKSRLGRDIGMVAAWAFYRRTLESISRCLSADRRWRTWIAVTPDSAFRTAPFWPPTCRAVPQGPGDLGERMWRPLLYLPPGPAVIVGTDIPDIQTSHIAAAFRALGNRDAVFGPARDGGYWLVGHRRRPRLPQLFTGVRWSTEHALADTLANLDGQSVALLETLDDIDDGRAYEEWLSKGRND